MGEDWHHKKEKQYKHQIQRGAMTLTQAPLFELPEEVEKQYMGQLDNNAAEVCSGQILTLFVSGLKARPALLAGTTAVGHMEGDSAADVISSLRSTAAWPVIVQLRVIEKMESTDSVILSPLKNAKGRR
jgi:hypothetical protein